MNKFYWLNDKSREFLAKGYLSENETPEERIRTISITAEKILNIDGFADKFEEYLGLGYFSLASPIWANFGKERGLPISCNGCFIPDSTCEIMEKVSEVAIQTKNGAGTSAYFGNIRGRGSSISSGGKSSGVLPFISLFDSVINVISQSNVRRGSFAAYIDVEHVDIEEFLQIKSEGNPIQNISFGVCISDVWMKELIKGNKQNRKIWAKIIQKRFESGYPYLFFTDTINNSAPTVYKDNRIKIHASNLCSEIALSSSKDESFVCDLSSINLLHWDTIKNTDAVETLTYFLDAVMSEYIRKTDGVKFMESANRFAKNQRALGIGTLGWHSYLQSKFIAFESLNAQMINSGIYKTIQEKSLKASQEMAQKYGEPPLLKGYGQRNVTLQAIAPTTSSSFILGQVSPSIEPLNSNYFVKDLAKGKFTYKNPYLKELLKKHYKDTKEVWDNILIKGGSVQHFDFLSRTEKDVFKTFGEISQKDIVIQAAQRQKYIDQSQSLNLMIHPDVSPKEVSQLLIQGWELGIKTFYYQRGTNPSQELGRKSILDCSSCQS